VRPGEGPFIERTAGIQAVRRERVFMPLSGHTYQPPTPWADALKRPSRSAWELL